MVSKLVFGAPPEVATVLAVAITESDPVETRAQLLATRLVLQEALGRLSADQLADLQAALETVVAGLRDEWSDTAPPEQTHMIDELDAICLRLRYHDQPIEHPHPEEDIAEERSYIGVCMRYETFPIDPAAPFPNCQTGRWLTMVRR